MPTDDESVNKLNLFLSSAPKVISCQDGREIFSGRPSILKISCSHDGTRAEIKFRMTKKLIENYINELAKESDLDKDVPNNLMEIILMYAQLIEEAELLEE